MLSHDRCVHGLIKGQCSICRKWSEGSHAKKIHTAAEKATTSKAKRAAKA